MPDQPSPLVTVIVPTRNRADLLDDLLQSLWRQTLDPRLFEVIVIDNQSTDSTPELLEHARREAPCRVVYVRAETNRGPVHSRNTAARMARGDILAFIDSDCRAADDWLEKGADIFRRDPEIAFASGAVLDKPEQPVHIFCFRNGAIPGRENYTYPACNIFYRKDRYQELGGFDEGSYSGDVGDKPVECADTDLAWRMRNRGWRNAYRDDMVVYHEVVPQTPWVWLKSQTRVVMVPMAVRLHPQLRREVCWRGPFFRPENALFYAGLLGLVLAVFVNPWFALLGLPYIWHCLTMGGMRFSIARIPRLAARVWVLGLRQAVICGSLLYGSLRTRTLIL